MVATREEQALEALHSLLSTASFDYADEQRCQQDIASFLEARGVPFCREYRLGTRYIDFYFPRSCIGLEIKASKQWSRRAVYKQCLSYCGFDQVKGLLLATGRYQGLPQVLAGKPVKVLQLGVAFL